MLRRTAALTLAVLIVPARSLYGEDPPVLPVADSPSPDRPGHSGSQASSAALLRHIASTLPKFDLRPMPTTPDPKTAAALPTREPPVMLPRFLVREPRPIEENEVMTAQAKENAIVKRYVGEPAGLDVALNKFTLNTLWKKIPVIGPISDFASPSGPSMTYGQRITLDYSKIEARRKYLEALGVSADVPPSKRVAGNKAPSPDSE